MRYRVMSGIARDSLVATDHPSRRTFFGRLLGWATGIVGSLAALGVAIPFVGYLLGPRRMSPIDWVDLGPISEERFPRGQTRLSEPFKNPLGQEWDGITALTSVFVRYLGKDEQSK